MLSVLVADGLMGALCNTKTVFCLKALVDAAGPPLAVVQAVGSLCCCLISTWPLVLKILAVQSLEKKTLYMTFVETIKKMNLCDRAVRVWTDRLGGRTPQQGILHEKTFEETYC